MFKLVASIVLSLSLLFLVREGVVSFKTEDAPAPTMTADRQPKASRPQPPKTIVFYPTVPSPLPDLKKGYLFNEERFLAGDTTEEISAEEETGTEFSVDIKTVSYAGSIIIGETRKALIYYPAQKPKTPQKRTDRKKIVSPVKKRNYAQLVAGDSLSGYKVVAVEPDRLVFEKGSETIEKMLNDPEKIRMAPPPLPKKAVRKKTTPQTSKRKRVELDKARSTTSRRAVQSSRKSSRKKTPEPQIQIPGVPKRN